MRGTTNDLLNAGTPCDLKNAVEKIERVSIVGIFFSMLTIR